MMGARSAPAVSAVVVDGTEIRDRRPPATAGSDALFWETSDGGRSYPFVDWNPAAIRSEMMAEGKDREREREREKLL